MLLIKNLIYTKNLNITEILIRKPLGTKIIKKRMKKKGKMLLCYMWKKLRKIMLLLAESILLLMFVKKIRLISC